MARLFRRGSRRREELLSAYVDGELTASEEREVEELLASSEDARRELSGLQAMVDLVGQLPELGLPRSFALDAAPKKRWTMWWPSVRATGLATSVATMLLVGLVAGDMLNVLEQAQFGSDDAEYATNESAFTAAAASAPESAVAMDAPATPAPPMAQAARAVMDASGDTESATTESDERQSDSSADAPVVAAAQALPAAPAAAVAKSADVERDTEAPAPAAARMMADESSEEPETAERQAMQDPAPQTTTTGSAAMQENVAADVSEEDAPEPSEGPRAAMAPSPGEEAPVAMDDFADSDGEGLELPLAELQVVTAITIVLLTGATLVAVIRRRRSAL